VRRRESSVRPEALQVDDLHQILDREPAQVITLLKALAEFRQTQPQWIKVIEHGYYGGLTLEETADRDPTAVPCNQCTYWRSPKDSIWQTNTSRSSCQRKC
jgi:hypothetical protein